MTRAASFDGVYRSLSMLRYEVPAAVPVMFTLASRVIAVAVSSIDAPY